jgi:hypothetical protein
LQIIITLLLQRFGDCPQHEDGGKIEADNLTNNLFRHLRKSHMGDRSGSLSGIILISDRGTDKTHHQPTFLKKF